MSIKAQNHMHLALTVSVTGEKAPLIKWKTTDEQPTPVAVVSIDTALDSTVRVHRSMRGGSPVRLRNYSYKVKLDDYDGYTLLQRMDLLEAMQGEKVYLVPHTHQDNGEDHSTYVRPMILAQMGNYEPLNINALTVYYVSIELIDARYLA